MSFEVLPIDSKDKNYKVDIELSGQIFRFKVLYNIRLEFWTISIFTTDDEPIVQGVKIISNFPIFAKFTDDRLPPGDIIPISTENPPRNPGENDLGNSVVVMYQLPDAA